MQSFFTNNDWSNAPFLFIKAHFGATRVFYIIFEKNLRFIYADTSASSAEFLMSDGPVYFVLFFGLTFVSDCSAHILLTRHEIAHKNVEVYVEFIKLEVWKQTKL
jgi:hypothetical protein